MFPVIAKDSNRFIAELKEHGYDSSGWRKSATLVPTGARKHLGPKMAVQILDGLVFVPCYPEMPDSEIARQAKAINEIMQHLEWG